MPNKLEKLKEVYKIINQDTVSKQEAVKLFKVFKKAVDELKTLVSSSISENDKEIKKLLDVSLRKVDDSVKKFENKTKQITDTVVKDTRQDLDKLAQNIYREIKKIEGKIPQATDLTELENKIKEITIKETPELTSKQIRDKLEELGGTERLDIEAIRGITVSATPPPNPQLNDIWIDIS